MPKPPSHQRDGSLTPDPGKAEVEEDSILAHTLQPLLEQEALLEYVPFALPDPYSCYKIFPYRSFIEQATAQRKFEDVKSLKINLAEIKAEINKMAKDSQITTNGNNTANKKK